MQILIGIICFLIFIFTIYLLCKDDYILIRKNISMEQVFDFAFLGALMGLILSGIITFFAGNLRIPQPFSLFSGFTYSLTLFFFSSFLSFYIIGKNKKYPLGRMIDYVSISYLSALPLWYLLNTFFLKSPSIFIFLGLGIFYSFTGLLFWKYLLPGINKNKLREGTVSSFFMTLFAAAGLLSSVLLRIIDKKFTISLEDILLLLILIAGITIIIRIDRKVAFKRKTN